MTEPSTDPVLLAARVEALEAALVAVRDRRAEWAAGASGTLDVMDAIADALESVGVSRYNSVPLTAPLSGGDK